jgi:hypothetical protein
LSNSNAGTIFFIAHHEIHQRALHAAQQVSIAATTCFTWVLAMTCSNV